jgi:hypothetical protein
MKDLTDPTLKRYADNGLTSIRKHLDKAEKISTSLGTPSSSNK